MSTTKRTRLTDILTREVSLVDRAANKRTFLVTKADGEQMPTELVPDGKGGFVAPAVEAPARPALVETIEKLTALANAPAPAGGEAEIAKAVSEVVAPLVVTEDKPLPAAFESLAKADAVEVQKMVIGAIAKLNEIATALGKAPEAAEYPYGVKWSICDALEGLVKVAELEQAMLAVAALPVAKAEEVVVETPEPAPAPTPELTIDIEKYRAVAKGLKNTLDSFRVINDDTKVSSSTDFDPTSASKLLDASTKVIKSLQARIATLEGAVVMPNALPVEGVTKSVADDAAWPHDMNRSDTDITF